jgi:hypothetical protein
MYRSSSADTWVAARAAAAANGAADITAVEATTATTLRRLMTALAGFEVQGW